MTVTPEAVEAFCRKIPDGNSFVGMDRDDVVRFARQHLTALKANPAISYYRRLDAAIAYGELSEKEIGLGESDDLRKLRRQANEFELKANVSFLKGLMKLKEGGRRVDVEGILDAVLNIKRVLESFDSHPSTVLVELKTGYNWLELEDIENQAYAILNYPNLEESPGEIVH